MITSEFLSSFFSHMAFMFAGLMIANISPVEAQSVKAAIFLDAMLVVLCMIMSTLLYNKSEVKKTEQKKGKVETVGLL